MAKETANMVGIRIVYRKQVIKAGANNLRICIVVSCIPYPHIHLVAAISFIVYFLRNSGIFVKAHIFWKRKISRVRVSITWPTLYN
jgi:hypothetical protein